MREFVRHISIGPEDLLECEKELIAMVQGSVYITDPSFSANNTKYPDNLIPFVDKHMDYIRRHPTTDPHQYIANLKLMTKMR